MAVAQIRTVWTGGPSAPGLTVMNVQDTGSANWGAAAAAVRAFFNSLSGGIPNEYSLQVDPLIESYSETTGALIGEVSLSPAATPAVITCTNTGGYAAGVGGRIDWTTSDIRNGRRVRGRTFIVPMASTNFGVNGEITGANTQAWAGFAQTLLGALQNASAPLVVWSRPTLAQPVGTMAPVIGLRVPVKASVLRGRRD